MPRAFGAPLEKPSQDKAASELLNGPDLEAQGKSLSSQIPPSELDDSPAYSVTSIRQLFGSDHLPKDLGPPPGSGCKAAPEAKKKSGGRAPAWEQGFAEALAGRRVYLRLADLPVSFPSLETSPYDPDRRACASFSRKPKELECCMSGYAKGIPYLMKAMTEMTMRSDRNEPLTNTEKGCRADFKKGQGIAARTCKSLSSGGECVAGEVYHYLGCFSVGYYSRLSQCSVASENTRLKKLREQWKTLVNLRDEKRFFSPQPSIASPDELMSHGDGESGGARVYPLGSESDE